MTPPYPSSALRLAESPPCSLDSGGDIDSLPSEQAGSREVTLEAANLRQEISISQPSGVNHWLKSADNPFICKTLYIYGFYWTVYLAITWAIHFNLLLKMLHILSLESFAF